MSYVVGIEMNDVVKKYGGHTVLDGVSLRVLSGECISITGQNGCGKSTLLRIAAGLAPPTRGGVIRGKGCSIQYVPDQFPPIPLTGRQFLGYMARADNALRPQSVPSDNLIREFHMDAHLDQPIAGYSKGMRSKIGALQALLARPGLLLLDEPVSGQDAQARDVFISAIKNLMAEGCAVIVASHERELIDALSTRVYHISNGKLASGYWLAAQDKTACLCAKCRLYAEGACAGRAD